MNRSPIAFALVLTSTCSGCYSTWDIAPSEMKKLDGYRAPMGKVVHDKAGADVPVDASTELAFRATTGEHIEAKFDSLTVPPSFPTGLLGTVHGEERRVWIDLARVGSVTAKRYSAQKTGNLVAGILAGAAVAFTLTYFGVKAAVADH